jgi:hypothetical protein
MGVVRNVYKILVKNPETKTLLRPKHRWEDNIKTYLYFLLLLLLPLGA